MTKLIKHAPKLKNINYIPASSKKAKNGQTPTDWHVKRLGDLFTRVTRKNTVGNDNVLTISAQYGLINQEDFFNKIVASENTSDYYLLERGEFAYNKSYSKGYPYGAIKQLTGYDSGVVSPLYICFALTDSESCPEYYVHYFEAGLMNSEIKAFAQEGARNHGLLNIAVDDLFRSAILVPPLPEQRKIAAILSTQDKVIELKSSLLDEKLRQKKYLAQFLLSGKKRLKGFDDVWKYVAVKDVFTFIKNNSLSRKGLTHEFGQIRCIHYGDILINYNSHIDITNDTIPYVKASYEKNCDSFLCNGDIVMADVAEDTLSGKACEIINIGTHLVVAGIDVFVLRPHSDLFSFGFLGHYMNTRIYHNQLIHYLQGVNVCHLPRKAVLSSVVPVPSRQEQNHIIELLSTADQEIELLRRELDLEKQKKKALMQLLLTGKVRVKTDE